MYCEFGWAKGPDGCDMCKCKEAPSKPGFCPAVESDQLGTCEEECRIDDDCEGNQKCCSNGCGHVCTAPEYKGMLHRYLNILIVIMLVLWRRSCIKTISPCLWLLFVYSCIELWNVAKESLSRLSLIMKPAQSNLQLSVQICSPSCSLRFQSKAQFPVGRFELSVLLSSSSLLRNSRPYIGQLFSPSLNTEVVLLHVIQEKWKQELIKTLTELANCSHKFKLF